MPWTSLGQSTDTDSISGIHYFQKGSDHYEKGLLDSSAYYFQKAAPYLLRSEQYEYYVNSLNARFAFISDIDGQTSEEYGLKAFHAAEKYLNAQSSAYGYALSNLSTLYEKDGLYQKGISLMKKARAVFLAQEKPPSEALILCNRNIGVFYRLLGDYDQALHYYFQALYLIEQNDKSDSDDFADFYSLIGKALKSKKHYTDAITYYQKAEGIYLASTSRNRKKRLLYTYHKMAVCYMDMLQYEKASLFLKKAFVMAEPFHIHKKELITLYNIGVRLSIEQGHYLKGKRISQKAITLFEENEKLAERRAPHADLLRLSASADMHLGNYPEALYLLNRALHVLIPDFKPITPSDNPILEQVNDYTNTARITALKAKVLSLQAASQEDNTELWQQSHGCYLMASLLFRKARESYVREESKLLLSSKSKSTYEEALSVAHHLYRSTGANSYLEDAFHYFEQNKALSLYEAFLDSKAKFGLPDSLLEQERTIKKHISELHYNKEQERGKLFYWQEQYQQLMEQLEQDYPSYYRSKYEIAIPSLSDIQQQISSAKDTHIISFFYGKEHLYLIHIGPDKIHFDKLDSLSLIQSKYRQLMRKTRGFDVDNKVSVDSMALASHQLYYLLLKESLDNIPKTKATNHLVLIPDGPLWYLSFEMLLSAPPSKDKSRKIPYLLRDYSISYQHSATYWSQLQEHGSSSRPKGKNWSGFAADYLNSQVLSTRQVDYGDTLFLSSMNHRGSTYWELPFAKEEVLRIADITDGQAYIGSEATKSTFLQQASNCSVLHLALHGLLDSNNSMYNSLVFTSDSSDIMTESSENAVLYAHEVYNMSLRTDLIVLSACDTGIGHFNQGEGVMSLARAFTYAGAKSVVTGLWQIPDRSTSILMTAFYRALKEGLPKDEALRKAKLEYIDQQEEAYLLHPYFWAGAIISGNTAPLLFETDRHYSIPWYYWCLLLLIPLAFIVYKWKSSRRS